MKKRLFIATSNVLPLLDTRAAEGNNNVVGTNPDFKKYDKETAMKNLPEMEAAFELPQTKEYLDKLGIVYKGNGILKRISGDLLPEEEMHCTDVSNNLITGCLAMREYLHEKKAFMVDMTNALEADFWKCLEPFWEYGDIYLYVHESLLPAFFHAHDFNTIKYIDKNNIEVIIKGKSYTEPAFKSCRSFYSYILETLFDDNEELLWLVPTPSQETIPYKAVLREYLNTIDDTSYSAFVNRAAYEEQGIPFASNALAPLRYTQFWLKYVLKEADEIWSLTEPKLKSSEGWLEKADEIRELRKQYNFLQEFEKTTVYVNGKNLYSRRILCKYRICNLMLANGEWKYQTFYSLDNLDEESFTEILDKAIWHPDTPVVENTFVDKKVFKEHIDKSFSVLIKQTNNRENYLEETPDLENAVLYVKYDPATDVIEICDHEKAREEFNEIMQKALPFNSINR